MNIIRIPDVRSKTGIKSFTATTDQDPLSYQVGDTVRFNVSLLADREIVTCPMISWEAKTDDGKSYSGTVVQPSGTVTIAIPATGTGFIRLKVFAKDEDGNLISDVRQSTSYNDATVFSAGVNTSQITAAKSEPGDFDSFWAEQVAKVNGVSPNVLSMVRWENPTGITYLDGTAANANAFEFYRVKIQTPSECGYAVGVLSIPKNATANSKGITVVFNGYGVEDLHPYASSGQIVLNVCAHSIELGRESSYYTNLSNKGGTLYNYCFTNTTKESSYFRTMIMRDLQAVRFVKAYAGTSGVSGVSGSASLGLWNGRLRLYGGSQGAFQGIAVAALDHDVTEAFWWIPWMCDVGGTEVGRMKSEFRPSYTDALRYYDTVSFGKRIDNNVWVTLTAGLGDYTCPPSGIMSLYNTMGGKVTFTFKQGMTHGYTPVVSPSTTYKNY